MKISTLSFGPIRAQWVRGRHAFDGIHSVIFPKADKLLGTENLDHSKALIQKLVTFSLAQDQYAKAQRCMLKAI